MFRKSVMVGMIVFLVMFWIFPVAQAYVDFDSGNTETIDYYINDAVRVDFNIANIPGTHLILESGADIYNELSAYNNSKITINDGIVGNRVNGYGNSQLTISGGTLEDKVISWDNSQVMLTGNANVPSVLAENNGNIHIYGGTINGYIEAYDNSSIYISGGTFKRNIYAIENGIITLEGNNFKVGNVNVNGLLDITYLLNVGALIDHSGGSYNQYNGILTGELADGTVLSNPIEIMHRPQGTVFMNGANFNIIPEPASLSLILLGGLLLDRRKRH